MFRSAFVVFSLLARLHCSLPSVAFMNANPNSKRPHKTRFKPTAVEEAARGTLVLSSVLWSAVPSFLRRLSASMSHHLGSPLSLSSSPVTFGSWMGGDRDGNPNVTPDVTREVMIKNRVTAANLVLGDVEKLIQELAVTEGR